MGSVTVILPKGSHRDKPHGGTFQLSTMLGTGVELAGVVTVLTLIGWWLDQRFETSPWLILTAAVMGIIGCLYKIWLIWQRMYQDRN